MTTPAGRTERSPRPESGPPSRFAYLRWLPLGATAILVAEAACYLPAPDWIQVHAESGPIELMQNACWSAAALIAGAEALRRRGTDRLFTAWLFVVGTMAAARELDLHEWLNPDRIGRWGVSFRADWWFSLESAPLWLKAAWALAFALLAFTLLAPMLALWRPALRLLVRGDAAAGLFAVAIACMGCGYISDDLLRHAGLPVEPLQAIEETFELFGAASFLASVILLAHTPFGARLARLAGPGSAPRYREAP
ncbi:MAG: hypothetical protein WD749_00290 [Phycisphaerales bacterium]